MKTLKRTPFDLHPRRKLNGMEKKPYLSPERQGSEEAHVYFSATTIIWQTSTLFTKLYGHQTETPVSPQLNLTRLLPISSMPLSCYL